MKYSWIIVLLCILLKAKSQFYTLPNQWMFQQIQDINIFSEDTNISTSNYPKNPFVVQKFSDIDTAYHLFKYIKNDPALDILFEKDILSVKKNDLWIKINPLLNFQKGQQTADTNISIFTNTRGFIASLKLQNVYIETLLSENQSVFPEYLYQYSQNSTVIPGQGRWKVFKKSGFDYAFSAGIVSIQANKNINITIGTGKQKIGNGYRSLLLSDNAFVYPFIKIEQNWWKGKLQYITTYALLNNMTPASIRHPQNTERLFQKKPFVYQYLNVALTKHTRLGLFQGIIGESPDTMNAWRGDGILFSPVIYSQVLYYGLNNKNNVLLGIDAHHRLLKTLMIYGQAVLNDNASVSNWDNAITYQIGFKWLGKFHDWKILLLGEWNDVKDNTYSSPLFDKYSNSSYSHFNQSLAYTPEKGNEFVSVLSIKKQRWILYGQFNSQQNPYYSKNTTYYKILFGFIVNPSYNLMIDIGTENRLTEKNNNYIYFQLQTALYNMYYDF